MRDKEIKAIKAAQRNQREVLNFVRTGFGADLFNASTSPTTEMNMKAHRITSIGVDEGDEKPVRKSPFNKDSSIPSSYTRNKKIPYAAPDDDSIGCENDESSTIVRKRVASLIFGYEDSNESHQVDLEQVSSRVHVSIDPGRVRAGDHLDHEFDGVVVSPTVLEPSRRRVMSMQAGAYFHAQGCLARAQSKGVLTPLQENSVRASLYSQTSTSVNTDAGNSQRESRDTGDPNKTQDHFSSRCPGAHVETASRLLPLRARTTRNLRDVNDKRKLCIFYTSVAALLTIGGIALGIYLTLLFSRDGDDKHNGDEHLSKICSNALYPSGQPDIYCQCRYNGAITHILNSTKTNYDRLRLIANSTLQNEEGKAISATKPLILNKKILSGLQSLNQSACEPRNIALLNLAALNSTDLEHYGLIVLYLSMGAMILPHKWDHINRHNTCDWPGIICGSNDKYYEVKLPNWNLQGTIPAEVGLLNHLKGLDVTGNARLAGTIPTEIRVLTQLTYMKLGNCGLSGRIPIEFGSRGSIEDIVVEGNYFTGTIPTEIGQLKKLTTFLAKSNIFMGTLPTEFAKLSSLSQLDVLQNKLSGRIPSDLGTLTDLKKLGLGRNVFDHSLPTEIWRLHNLEYLSLESLQLVGRIPWDKLDMKDLEYLHFGGNSFSGTISPAIGELTSLKAIAIFENRFEGQIPTEIGLLTMLSSIDLNRNLFTGSIPNTLSNLTNLEYLSLGWNHELSGNMEEFCSSVATVQSNGVYLLSKTEFVDDNIHILGYQQDAQTIICSCCNVL